jgi:hypothetical protein
MNDVPDVQLPEVGKTGAMTRSGLAPMPLVPETVEQCWQMAQYFSLSGAVPDSFPGRAGDKQNIAAVFGAIQVGANVGLSPVTALSVVMMVNSRYAMFGDGQLAIVRKSGLLEYIKESFDGEEPKVGQDWDHGYTAVCIIKRVETEPEERFEFSVGDAVRAGLWAGKDVWKKYPKRMLKHRCRAFAMRDLFGDVLLGLQHSAEELIDAGGDLVQDGQGNYVPDRPTRADFTEPTEGVNININGHDADGKAFKSTVNTATGVVTDAEVVSEGGISPEPKDDASTAPEPSDEPESVPAGFVLLDAFGEERGRYSPGEWIDEFCHLMDKATSVGALEALYNHNASSGTWDEVEKQVDNPEVVDPVFKARRQALVDEAEAEQQEAEAGDPDLLGGIEDG